ncbi:hypothetical protein [Stella sp.]|uniref:hypothetical protein n=1 Tax=Stella sp. TaxID=2912054 RepID=UPI0035AD98E8
MNAVPVPRDIPLPLPASEPVLVAVLVVFFLVHIVFVNFMVGGALLTLYYEVRGLREPRYDRLAQAVAATITANKSLAVVLGIGPLLAINTLYTVHFYTANALTGGFWIGIVPLVVAAFVLTYVHKYCWTRMERTKALHVALAGAAALLFLFIPLIFLANVNLMLFPERWTEVGGFFSALALPNVLPRYLHFVLACPAMTGLFLVWLFRREPEAAVAATGFTRSELVRAAYRWALWPTVAQFAVGPLALATLPATRESLQGAWVAFAVATLVALAMTGLLYRETRRDDARIGRSFASICTLMLVVVALMGVGRHLYREAAVAPHRDLVRAKTERYLQAVEDANRRAGRDGGDAGRTP